MPIYEYRCVANGHRFERLQEVGATAPSCPVCGTQTVRVFTRVGVIFKGRGFHTTEYRRPSPNGEKAADEKPAEKPTEAKSSETKPPEP